MTKPGPVTLRLRITGRVQGVGYRDWMVTAARRHHVAGWVRNLATGEVEALIHGAAEDVASLQERCRSGPPLARVDAIVVEAAEPFCESGFRRTPSA